MDFLGIARTQRYGAAVLIRNQDIISSQVQVFGRAARKKSQLPLTAIAECLACAGIKSLDTVGAVGMQAAYSLEIGDIFSSTMDSGRGLFQALKNLPQSLREELSCRLGVRRDLLAFEGDRNPEVLFFTDELAWARGIYQAQADKRTAILDLDLNSDERDSHLTLVTESGPQRIWTSEFPGSLSLLVRNLAAYCGFHNRRQQRQFMQLAQYGDALLQEEMERLIRIESDGCFWINTDLLVMDPASEIEFSALRRLFASRPRQDEAPITSKEIAIAYSLEEVLQTFVLANWSQAEAAGMNSLIFPMGNSALNSRLKAMLKASAGRKSLVALSEKELVVRCATGLALSAQSETLDLPIWEPGRLVVTSKELEKVSADLGAADSI